MSIKNKLQEFCQRQFGELPFYESYGVNFEQPYLFQSKVHLPSGHLPSGYLPQGKYTFEGEPASSKKQAQKNAAVKAYKALVEEYGALLTSGGGGDDDETDLSVQAKRGVATKYQPPLKPARYVLIDAESIPQSLTTNNYGVWDPEDDYVVGFAGYCSSQATLKQSRMFEQMCEFHITHSPTPDAADHALSFYAGMLAEMYKQYDKPSVLIISRDKFAATTVERLREYGFLNVRHQSRPL